MITTTPRPLVLLLEDDPASALGLARMLGGDGFDVERAMDVPAAIARLTQFPIPNALVTDFFVSHGDGMGLIQLARSRSPNLAAVVVTGHPELTDHAAMALVPAPVVLTKPLDYDVLVQTLRNLLRDAAKG